MTGSLSEMQNSGGVKDMREMMSFQRRLMKMDTQELLAAFDSIAALDLGEEERMMLEKMLIGPLVTKDPELALNRFANRLNDDKSGLSWQLGNALGEWAKKDATAATAWFDKQIAAGSFDTKSLDGKSQIRKNFESNLIKQLLSSDPAAAGARVTSLPTDQRKDVLNGLAYQLSKKEDQTAYADLVRSQLSEKDSLEVLGGRASAVAMMGKLEDVGEYLDSIGATPVERVHSAEQAAISNISRSYPSKSKPEDIDKMREWLGTQAPGSVEKVTGQSVARMINQGDGIDFKEGAALALKYHESSRSDDVLTGFLNEAGTNENKEQAREIAGKISDPTKRAEQLEKLK
jgi:hypothetical protein